MKSLSRSRFPQRKGAKSKRSLPTQSAHVSRRVYLGLIELLLVTRGRMRDHKVIVHHLALVFPDLGRTKAQTSNEGEIERTIGSPTTCLDRGFDWDGQGGPAMLDGQS